MSEGAARLRPRVALISIAAFWALYFTILTIRALLVYQMHSGMGKRAIVSIASMGITALFYVLIRRIPIRRLGVAIATAAVLAVPAAIVYATVNYRVFEYGMKHVADAGRVVKPSSPAAPPHPAALPGAGRTGAVAPPAPPTALSVGPAAEDERMAALYRQHVLKEEPAGPVIQIQGLGGKKKDPVQEVLHKDQQ